MSTTGPDASGRHGVRVPEAQARTRADAVGVSEARQQSFRCSVRVYAGCCVWCAGLAPESLNRMVAGARFWPLWQDLHNGQKRSKANVRSR